jgi:hypothetical protein
MNDITPDKYPQNHDLVLNVEKYAESIACSGYARRNVVGLSLVIMS